MKVSFQNKKTKEPKATKRKGKMKVFNMFLRPRKIKKDAKKGKVQKQKVCQTNLEVCTTSQTARKAGRTKDAERHSSENEVGGEGTLKGG